METVEKKKKILSCVQASGTPTLGNYLGAFKNWKSMSEDYDCCYAVADLHAITVRQDPKQFKKQILEMYAIYSQSVLIPSRALCSFRVTYLSIHSLHGY